MKDKERERERKTKKGKYKGNYKVILLNNIYKIKLFFAVKDCR